MANRRDMLKLASTGLLSAAYPLGATASASRTDWSAAADQAAALAVQSGRTAGLAVGIFKEGRTLHARGHGFANLETMAAADENSVFRIASITKTFTATAVMLLVESGALRLESSLADFYPAIPGAREVTIRQLLSHTSGIRDFVRGGLPADALGWTTPDAFAGGVARMSPLYDFSPGSRFSYSNSGYILLGGVIEKAAGTDYAAFLQQRIFGPAGMVGTAVDSVADVVRGRADGYSLRDGKPGSFRHADYTGMPFSAGAVRSTVTDLGRWARQFFGGHIVSPAIVREMLAPARVSSGAVVGDARWWPPEFKPGNPPPFITESNYGLGWDLTRYHGRPTAGHSGGINGFNSILVHYLDEDLTFVLLANTDNGIIPPFEALIKRAGERGPAG